MRALPDDSKLTAPIVQIAWKGVHDFIVEAFPGIGR
jgi:hypothetical protein